MKPYDRPPPLVRAAVTCLVLGVFMVSCGDDDSASTAATTPDTPFATAGPTSTAATTPPDESSATGSSVAPSGVCADQEALRTSVDALTNLDVTEDGTNALTTAISDLKDDLAAVRSSANAELQPQVQAVQDAADELETAVANVDSDGAATAATAMADLVTSARTLLDSLEAGACGESTTAST